jgi:hypothetical protein
VIHGGEMAEPFGQHFTFDHGFGGHNFKRFNLLRVRYFFAASNLPPTILPANP